jgi:hypothetical protein
LPPVVARAQRGQPIPAARLPGRASLSGEGRDSRPAEDRQEKIMMNHDLTAQLARDHHRQMLAEASQRQRYQPRFPAPRTPRAAARAIRSLAAALTRARMAATEAPGARWPARPGLPGEPVVPARPLDSGH